MCVSVCLYVDVCVAKLWSIESNIGFVKTECCVCLCVYVCVCECVLQNLGVLNPIWVL